MVVVGGMWANTETSRSSARAGASTTMSIEFTNAREMYKCSMRSFSSPIEEFFMVANDNFGSLLSSVFSKRSSLN